MSELKRLISVAKDQVKGQVSGAVNEAKTQVLGEAKDIFTDAVSLGRGGLQQVLNNTIGAITGKGISGPIRSPSDVSSSPLPAGPIGNNVLKGALARTDPILSFHWYAELPWLDSFTLPWYYVEEAVTPFARYDTRSIYREGKSKHYAGTYSVDNLRLNFFMDSTNKSVDYFMYWMSLIKGPGGEFRIPSRYKKPISIVIMDVTNSVVLRITYTGCWPTGIDALNLNSGSSDRLVGNVEFSVDDVMVEIVEVEPQFISNTTSRDPNFPYGISGIFKNFQDNLNAGIQRGVDAASSVSASIGTSVSTTLFGR